MGDKGKCQVCSASCHSRCSFCRSVFYCCREHQTQDYPKHKGACNKKKYSVEEDMAVGRHLVATEDIKADMILLKDRPLLLSIKANTLDFTPNKICLGCYKEIKVDDEESSESSSSSSGESNTCKNVCSKCGLPICSPRCSFHYFHKEFECRLISEAKPFSAQTQNDAEQGKETLEGNNHHPLLVGQTAESLFPSEEGKHSLDVRDTIQKNLILFRCLLLKHVSPSAWDQLMSLQSDEELRRELPQLERSTKFFNILKRILAHINHPNINQVAKPDVHKILGILDINAIHFNFSQEVELSALFPSFSLMEHCCVPNSRYYISPIEVGSKGSKYLVELYARSSVKIKKGESLSVSYVNLMWNTEKRREFLKKERGFLCCCKRCLDPYELGSNFSTIICTQEGCNGYSVPLPKNSVPSHDNMQWKCSKCGKCTPPWQVKKLDARLCELFGKTKACLEGYKSLLSKMKEVHPDYYLAFVVNHSLVQLYGERDAENDSEDENVRSHCASMLEEKVALCNRLLQIIKILDPGLAKLNVYTAVIYYEMQSAILAMSGGEVDDDFYVLRNKPESVKLAKLYLLKCIDCFKYEFLDLPENKLKNLAFKKMEYLDFILKKFKPNTK